MTGLFFCFSGLPANLNDLSLQCGMVILRRNHIGHRHRRIHQPHAHRVARHGHRRVTPLDAGHGGLRHAESPRPLGLRLAPPLAGDGNVLAQQLNLLQDSLRVLGRGGVLLRHP